MAQRIEVLEIEADRSVNAEGRQDDAWRIVGENPEFLEWDGREAALDELDDILEYDREVVGRESDEELAAFLLEARVESGANFLYRGADEDADTAVLYYTVKLVEED